MVGRNKLLSVASGSRWQVGQTGAALVIVLGLVSVMCVTAVVAFNMFGMFARKTANSQMFSQAREYALAGEMLGAKRAGAFIKVNEFFVVNDTVSDAEKRLKIDMPIDGGRIVGALKEQDYLDMPELLNKKLKDKHKIIVYPIHEYWLDIGRLDSLDKAKMDWD